LNRSLPTTRSARPWSGRCFIGEAAARFPDEWKQRRPQVPWRKIIGLRNLLAHGYWAIDAEELWDIARNMVPEFVAELRPLLDQTD
jgi:uncharacterized protein with HEPN domain